MDLRRSTDFTLNACLHLSIADLFASDSLPVSKDILLHWDHPYRRVKICGIITAKDERERNISYYVDDGSGVVGCTEWFPESVRSKWDRRTLPLGALVTVQGKVSEYNHQRQIVVNIITRETDPNAELLWWLEVADLAATVYRQRTWLPPDFEAQERPKGMAGMVLAAADANDMADRAATFDPFSTVAAKMEPEVFRSCCERRKREIMEKLSDNSVVPPTQQDFNRLLEAVIWLQDTIPEVRYEVVRRDPSLCELARRIVKEGSRLDKAFQNGFSALKNAGSISFHDEQADTYKVVRHDVNLGEAVLRIIARSERLAGGGRYGEAGITEDQIQLALCTDGNYRHVTRSIIVRSVKALEQDSLIYEVQSRQYKAFEEFAVVAMLTAK
ncbi:CST complex subunit STN1 [Irineochytrium annulatum]|nr:CST complex subunit STN1 [Irineochytrium annulatum]